MMVRRITLGDFLLIAEMHLGMEAQALARVPHVVALAEAALGGLDETAHMLERIAGDAGPPLTEDEFLEWVAERVSYRVARRRS